MEEEERYEIKGKIGEGGRGAVYRAYDRQLHRNVAIKRLFTNGADDGESREDLIKESHALSAINSPHIVRVFDMAKDEEGPYVVMELLEGKTLHEIVSRAPLVPQEFMTIAEQALEALIAAHEAKLLHRDIKPGNLMLTWLPSGRMQLKLLDFGLAKFTEKPAVQTMRQEGSVLGSIYFMAPEQFGRSPLDVRTDLYSLGCVLYYALTGQVPFNGGTATEVMAAHIQGDCHDLAPLRPDLPPALARWVMQLISREMDDRPATAQEALDRFELAKQDTTPVSTESVPSRPRLITGREAETGTQPVPTAAQGLHSHTTATTTILSAPGRGPDRTKKSPLPPWVLATGSILLLSIVALGVAMAMRGDPGKTVTPPTPIQGPVNPNAIAPAPAPGPHPGPVKPAEKPNPPDKPKWNASEDFKRKDQNGDFKLSSDEFVVTKDDPWKSDLQKRFKELDKNKDGSLTLAEFKHWKQDKK